MYSDNPEPKITQGDVYQNCRFYIPPPASTEELQITADANGIKQRLYSGNAMVITQSCDIDDNPSVHLAVVMKLTEFRSHLVGAGQREQTVDSIIGQLKSRKPHYKELEMGLFHLFYLPPKGNLEESVAQLNINAMVSKDILNIEDRLIHMSDSGRQWVQYYLIRLWGRPYI